MMSKRHNDYPTLHELDRDGALREAAACVDGQTRKAFMGKLGALVAGGLVAGALPVGLANAASGGVSKGDIAILNYALTLEYLEAAFYKEAVSKGALSGETATFAKTVAQHEAAHVAALKKTLGSKAVKEPSFDFKGTTASQGTFAKTALTLEDTGVKAYLGQAGNIKSSAVLKAAASILPVEARHAAWMAEIIGMGASPSPAPDAFQPSASMSEVITAVKGTGFLSAMAGADPSSATPGQPAMTG
jgi:rubrerythrin